MQGILHISGTVPEELAGKYQQMNNLHDEKSYTTRFAPCEANGKQVPYTCQSCLQNGHSVE
jgi:hypothetical protein